MNWHNYVIASLIVIGICLVWYSFKDNIPPIEEDEEDDKMGNYNMNDRFIEEVGKRNGLDGESINYLKNKYK